MSKGGNAMNNNFTSIILQEIKDFFSRYCILLLVSILLYFYSNKLTGVPQLLLQNICASLIVIPLVFLCRDFYKSIITRKQRQMVTTQLNNYIECIFINFVFQSIKFRKKFDEAVSASPDFIKMRKSSVDKIFDDVSSNTHNGYFIFSIFDDLCDGINKTLESPLFLEYAPNKIVSIVSEFSLEYQKLVEEFRFISKQDFIKISSLDNLEIKMSDETSASYDVYSIMELKNDSITNLYSAGYPIFDEEMIKGIYRISGTKAKELSKIIFSLYSIIDKWERANQKTLAIDNLLVASGRLVQKYNFNFHAKNNVSMQIQWF